MAPAASVSGLYLSHPQAKYFNVGRIGRDQLEDYAKRKGMTVEEAARWLGVGDGTFFHRFHRVVPEVGSQQHATSGT